MLRASGVAYDLRTTGNYAAYGNLEVQPVTSDIGDSYARCQVRIGELFQSMDLIRQAAGKIPDSTCTAMDLTPRASKSSMYCSGRVTIR